METGFGRRVSELCPRFSARSAVEGLDSGRLDPVRRKLEDLP
jgi:hypothetical protein